MNPPGPVEVKSLRPSATTVEISSATQLDGDVVQLAVVTLDEIGDPGSGLTLPDQVRQIRESLSDGSARADFDRRLAMLFVNLDDPWYRDHRYAVRRLQLFDAGRPFPAIRRSELPLAIPRTKYQLDLRFVSEFVTMDVSYA
jgi:hypothetical protein